MRLFLVSSSGDVMSKMFERLGEDLEVIAVGVGSLVDCFRSCWLVCVWVHA